MIHAVQVVILVLVIGQVEVVTFLVPEQEFKQRLQLLPDNCFMYMLEGNLHQDMLADIMVVEMVEQDILIMQVMKVVAVAVLLIFALPEIHLLTG